MFEITEREVKNAIVDVVKYNHIQVEREAMDAVYGFTHSREVNAICAEMIPPHTLIPMDKDALEQAMADYIQRRGVSPADEAIIRAWIAKLPDDIGIVEREI